MDFPSRPILQLAESSHRTHIVQVPAYAFWRLVSPSLLSFCSPFYEAFLNRHDTNFTTSSCSHCGSEHSVQQFCLPSDYSPAEVNFLFDFLERTTQETFAPDLFLSVIRLCDYLLIPHHVIFDLIQLYIPRHLRVRSQFTWSVRRFRKCKIFFGSTPEQGAAWMRAGSSLLGVKTVGLRHSCFVQMFFKPVDNQD